MSDSELRPVLSVSDARARLTGILRAFRTDSSAVDPIVIGSHRRADAVLVPYARYRELTASQRAGPLLPELRRRRALVERLARANRVERVQVFGSVARGDDDATSDLDLLVEPAANATLFDLAQLEMDLEALFDRPVDVVSIRSLDARRDAGIFAEAIPL
jgi:prevent-host-death family protein